MIIFQQYFLSDDSTSFFYNSLHNLQVSHVLCVGMPRLHEHIHFKGIGQKKHMKSFLLDIDSRYVS